MVSTKRSELEVVFVIGCPRSGSTVLGNLLAEAGLGTNAGEVRNLWWRAAAGRTCSCGATLASCSLWGPAIRAAEEASGACSTVELATLHRRVIQRRPFVFAPWLPAPPVQRYVRALRVFYEVVAARTASTRVIDVSKFPADFAASARAGGTISCVHLMRDPVAYVQSRYRQAHRATGTDTPPGLPFRTALIEAARWAIANAIARFLVRGHRHVLVRYEDLEEDPAGVLKRIAASLDWEATSSSTGHHYAGTRWSEGSTNVQSAPPLPVKGTRAPLIRALTAPTSLLLHRAERQARG